jgi:hypothetical protein
VPSTSNGGRCLIPFPRPICPQTPSQKAYTVAGLPIAALSAIASIASIILIVGVGSTVACCYYRSHRRRHAEERDVMPGEMVKVRHTVCAEAKLRL